MPELPQVVAPAFADGDKYEDGGEEIVEELHELLANGLIVLIALHVSGVILSSVRHRENLTLSMGMSDNSEIRAGCHRFRGCPPHSGYSWHRPGSFLPALSGSRALTP